MATSSTKRPHKWYATDRKCCAAISRCNTRICRHAFFGAPPASLSFLEKLAEGLASPAGLEPATPGLGNRCSIRLSYGDISPFQPLIWRHRPAFANWLQDGDISAKQQRDVLIPQLRCFRKAVLGTSDCG